MRKVKESSVKWIKAKYEYGLSSLLIEKIFDGYDREGDANYISKLERFKSISQLASFSSTAYYQLFIDVPFAGIFLFLIYVYGGPIVLVPLSLMILYVLVIFISSKRYFASQTDYYETNDDLMNQLIETLEKIHFVKAAGIEDTQIIKYKKLVDEVASREYSSNKFKLLPEVVAGKISQLSLFSVMIAGGYMYSMGMMSFGEITACAMLGGRAIRPLINLMRYYQQTRNMRLVTNRIEALVDQEGPYSEATPDFPEDILGSIEFLDLTYKDLQNNQRKTLNHKIRVGDFVAINPAKFPSYREIFRMISGRHPIEGGRVLIDNLDISQWNMYSLKGRIEYLGDEVSIFKGSVLDNISFFNSAEVRSALEASKVTGLDDLVSKMPEGFATQIDSQMRNYLSSAFLQRLSLSRALLERPRILILDRIDESMDQDTFDVYKWLLENLKGQVTILAATWSEEITGMADYQLNPL